MQYSIEKKEKCTVFTFEEEKVDALIAPEVKAEFVTLFNKGTKNLVIDMSAVKYVDSSGLSAFLLAHRMVKEAEGILVLATVSDHVMKLIKVTQLDQVLTILPTVVEGIEAVIYHEVEQELKADQGGEE